MQNTRFFANKSGIAGAIPLAYPKSRSFSRPQARKGALSNTKPSDEIVAKKEDAEASSFKGCGLVLVDGDDNAGANGTVTHNCYIHFLTSYIYDIFIHIKVYHILTQ